MRKRIIIMGAAGRDFHNFNVYYRGNENYEVVAFTAAQIPDIEDRRYPAVLAGSLYPEGIGIEAEEKLVDLIKEFNVDEVVFAYSDVSHEYVMDRASTVLAAGADFRLMGPKAAMLSSKLPVISVCAVRTGSGKSQTSRAVAKILAKHEIRYAAVRHPMPYGDLAAQAVQRFDTLEDMDRYNCTIEEREEYEPHIQAGSTVFAGVDYGAILSACEQEFQLVIWDGGNNDMPFYRPDLAIVLADPLRAGQERTYYPGAVNFRMADVILINKICSATPEQITEVEEAAKRLNPKAKIIKSASPVRVDDEGVIRGKRVVVIEDGPTLTHGGMKLGAGTIAAERFGAAQIVDPIPYAVGRIKETIERYNQTAPLLPALGYGAEQLRDLKASIDAVPADSVVIGTPINLGKVIEFNKPSTRVYYDLDDAALPKLEEVISTLLRKRGLIQ
ncbi:MAG: cyclic 2,3-diphosphoglycerate synthase [candidate division WOR-3 bacterium]|nr:cyclic 2,3-diphosphoglycerate synthase [candidate division WOR-3 bacterium]